MVKLMNIWGTRSDDSSACRPVCPTRDKLVLNIMISNSKRMAYVETTIDGPWIQTQKWRRLSKISVINSDSHLLLRKAWSKKRSDGFLQRLLSRLTLTTRSSKPKSRTTEIVNESSLQILRNILELLWYVSGWWTLFFTINLIDY